MKIMLIQPRRKDGLGLTGLSCLEPLALEFVASSVKEHDIKLIDLFEPREIEKEIKKFSPDICGISCSFTMDVNYSLEISRVIKRASPRTLVFIGGHHASLSPENFMVDSVDGIILGEGEITFRELVSKISGDGRLSDVRGLLLNTGEGFMETGIRELEKNIDPLRPFREISKKYRKAYYFGFESPVAMVETTRGCPYRCTFCSVHKFFRGKVRMKSPEGVVEELMDLPEEAVFFSDDNFFINPERSMRLAELIKREGIRKRFYIQARSDTIVRHPELVKAWAEVGLKGVFIGFERPDDEGLSELRKQNKAKNNELAVEIIKSAGVGPTGTFIIEPEETREGFRRILAYAKKLGLRSCGFTVLTPLPGTELFEKVKDKITSFNWDLYDCLHAVLPTKLPLNEFYEELSKLYKAFFETSVSGMESVRNALKMLREGKASIALVKKLMRAAKMLINPECYLEGHASCGGHR